MKILLLLLLSLNVVASTNIYDLELLGVQESFEHPGKLEILFNAETTNILDRGASENIMVMVSSDASFDQSVTDSTLIYETINGIVYIKERHLFPVQLGNARWFVKIAFAIGNSVENVIKIGCGPGDGWTYAKHVEISQGYESPVLNLPVRQGEPYPHDTLLLDWNVSNGIDIYTLQYSDHPDFLAGNGFISRSLILSHSDSGYRSIDISEFDEGTIYFRINGTLPNGSHTLWDYSELWYKKPSTTYYYFPWLTIDERGDIYVSIDTGTYTGEVKVEFGVRPKDADGYGSEISWRTKMVLPGKIFKVNIADIMLTRPEYIHQGVLNIKTSREVIVTVHQHLKIDKDSDDPANLIKTTDRLEAGSYANLVIPGFELDETHIPSIVIGNFDQSDYHESEYTDVRWELSWNDEAGARRTLTRVVHVPPQGNVAVQFTKANFPELPNVLDGTIRITNLNPNIDIAAYYSLSNNPTNGAQLFNFMMATRDR